MAIGNYTFKNKYFGKCKFLLSTAQLNAAIPYIQHKKILYQNNQH